MPPAFVLTAYDYIETEENKWGQDVIIHTGLRAINITQLDDYAVDNAKDWPLDKDPFADLVVEPPVVSNRPKRRRTKRREASDGQGLANKPRKQQVCSVCNETGHNKLTCKRLTTLEGDTLGLGVLQSHMHTVGNLY